MNTALLGGVFVIVGLAAMFLMYHLWGYPFDKATKTSSAPRWAMWTHRALGYLFALIYIFLMWKMVPRLWEYQVEFPARTTAHIILGFTIGFLLLIKIAIMRFFRHFEEWMPYLGTAIMLFTIVLIGLSLPYALQERARAKYATSAANIARVAAMLPTAGLPKDVKLETLATAKALNNGRAVLLENCVKCHDLRTILAKPRTPANWWSTVERMGDKPALFAPLSPQENYEVTAYLIAITPDLQKASKQEREAEVERNEAIDEAMKEEAATDPVPMPGTGSADPPKPTPGTEPRPTPGTEPKPTPGTEPPKPKPAPTVDLVRAKKVYEDVCSQCHDLSDVDAAPPKTARESRVMIERMIKENEAEISKEQIKLIAAWLDAHFVNKTH